MLKCILEKHKRVYVNWTEIAQDRVKKGAFVNTAIKLVVVVVVVYPLVPLGTQGICEASLSDPVACQPLTFILCFATFFCFRNSPFPGFLQSSSPFVSLFFSGFIPILQEYN